MPWERPKEIAKKDKKKKKKTRNAQRWGCIPHEIAIIPCSPHPGGGHTSLFKMWLPWAVMAPVSLKEKSLPAGSQAGKSSLFCSFLFSFFLFRATLLHMEVPRLGVESKLQLLAYTTASAAPDSRCICDLCHSLRQHQILNPPRRPASNLRPHRDYIRFLTL